MASLEGALLMEADGEMEREASGPIRMMARDRLRTPVLMAAIISSLAWLPCPAELELTGDAAREGMRGLVGEWLPDMDREARLEAIGELRVDSSGRVNLGSWPSPLSQALIRWDAASPPDAAGFKGAGTGAHSTLASGKAAALNDTVSPLRTEKSSFSAEA